MVIYDRGVRSLLVLGLSLAGCTFDTRGILGATADARFRHDRGGEGGTQADAPELQDSTREAVAADSQTRDGKPDDASVLDAGPKPDAQPLPDLKLAADAKPVPDVKSKVDVKPKVDLKLPDLKPPPDLGGFKPVGSAELLAVWGSLQVPCVGGPSASSIKPLDSSTYAALVNGTTTLAAAPADTKAWVGSKPSVTVIFDPNACGQEDPINGDGDWGSAGILIRGATLVAGKLLLTTGTGTGDMDFLDVTASGAFEGGSDFAKPDDSQLASYPQLVATVNALKQGILQAAKP